MPASQPFELQRAAATGLTLTYPKVSYDLSIDITDSAVVIARLFRPVHKLVSEERRPLGDLASFQQIARTAYTQSRVDNMLVRVLQRRGRQVAAALRNEGLGQSRYWHVEYHEPRIIRQDVLVEVTLQLQVLRETLPDVAYCLALRANRYGKCRAEITALARCVAGDGEVIPVDRRKVAVSRSLGGSPCWGIPTPSDWSGITIADLPQFAHRVLNLVASFVIDRLLPFASPAISAKARQSLLVLVPLRLARIAARRGCVAWYREIVADCLSVLAHQPANSNNLVQQLFFQLLQLLLADPAQRTAEYEAYESLGLKLVALRLVEQNLPFNPVLAYRNYLEGHAKLRLELTKKETRQVVWFLRKATLEQIVSALSLI
jgi:hypothetical protein